MKYFSCFSIATGLLCCLAASVAHAGLSEEGVGGQSDSLIVTALQLTNETTEQAGEVGRDAKDTSEHKSKGTSNAPSVSTGKDKSQGSAATGGEAQNFSFGSPGRTASGAGDTAPAPPGNPSRGDEGHSVGSPEASGAGVADLATAPAATSAIINGSTQPLDTPAVPIPATILLLGGGLCAIFPLRRSARLSPGF
jgi:hypothetical protein